MCEPAPKVVVVCITCVDALMGTDLERVCRAAQERCGVLVVPSYMYALEREGRRPPMSAIRTTIYSLLERLEVEPTTVNLMGFFTPLEPQSELFSLLAAAGVRRVNQVSAARTLEEYRAMGAANFNLVLDPESRAAAEDLRVRLGMPYVELARLYDPERIHHQYHLFFGGVGLRFDDASYLEEARLACRRFSERHAGTSFAVGEMCNANPFELSALLVSLGMEVRAVYSNVTANTHRVAAALMETGIDYRAANKRHFRTKTKKRLALEAELLRTMEFYDEGRVVVVTLPLSLAERLSLTEADMDDVSALGGVVEGTDCSITMKETKDGAWKISVRTGARVNATKACAALGGGGHRAASGCVYHGPLAEAKAAILAAVQAAVEE